MYVLEERNLDDDNFIKLVASLLLYTQDKLNSFSSCLLDVMLWCFRICIDLN